MPSIKVVAEKWITKRIDIPDSPGETKEESEWIVDIQVDGTPYIYAMFVPPELYEHLQLRFTLGGLIGTHAVLPPGGKEMIEGHPENTWTKIPGGSSEKLLLSESVEFGGEISQLHLQRIDDLFDRASGHGKIVLCKAAEMAEWDKDPDLHPDLLEESQMETGEEFLRGDKLSRLRLLYKWIIDVGTEAWDANAEDLAIEEILRLVRLEGLLPKEQRIIPEGMRSTLGDKSVSLEQRGHELPNVKKFLEEEFKKLGAEPPTLPGQGPTGENLGLVD